MISFLHKLVTLLVLLVLAGIGMMLVSSGWTEGSWGASLVMLKNGRLVVMFFGFAFLCLVAIFVLTGFPRKKKDKKFIPFKDAGGITKISREALSDYIAELSGEFPSILYMKPKVVPFENNIDVIVNVKIKASQQITEVRELLRQKIRETLTAGLGISDIRKVDIVVDEIVVDRKSD